MKQRKPMAIRKEPELNGKFGHYLTTVNGMEMYRRKKEYTEFGNLIAEYRHEPASN